MLNEFDDDGVPSHVSQSKGIFDFTSALSNAVCLIPSGREVYEIMQTRVCLRFLFGELHGGFG